MGVINPECVEATKAIAEDAARAAHVLQKCADDAAILTGIGIGTAFGLLVAMIVVITVARLITTHFFPTAAPGSSESEAEARDKAVAAVVAVTTLLANQSRTDERGAASG